MRAYEYHHIVGFEETNLVGNVYYANHIRWQGRCREMFLREHAPEILEEISRGLALVTLRVSCEYFHELLAFDELVIRMQLAELSQHRMLLAFEYWRKSDAGEDLVARGEQELGCMARAEGTGGAVELEPAAWPESLREALRPFEDR
jgi:enediyne biosynthesis thioesterase